MHACSHRSQGVSHGFARASLAARTRCAWARCVPGVLPVAATRMGAREDASAREDARAPQHYSYSYNGSNSWLAELLSFHMSNSHGNS